MTRKKRIMHIARLLLTPSATGRMKYMKKHNLFGMLGKNVHIQGRILPLYSNLIYIHDNVMIASDVTFVTHDIVHKMLNNKYKTDRYSERVGCIEIMDNVFIGAGTKILYNTRIGSNVIVGAGSIVTRDIPDNSVYAGIPARYICSFDEYVEKAQKYSEDSASAFGNKRIREMDDGLAQKIYAGFVAQRDEEQSRENND